MRTVSELTIVAFGLIAILVAWGTAQVLKHGPSALIRWIRPSFSCSFVGGVEEQTKQAAEWGVRLQAQQLAEAGFMPLGLRVEKAMGRPT